MGEVLLWDEKVRVVVVLYFNGVVALLYTCVIRFELVVVVLILRTGIPTTLTYFLLYLKCTCWWHGLLTGECQISGESMVILISV